MFRLKPEHQIIAAVFLCFLAICAIYLLVGAGLGACDARREKKAANTVAETIANAAQSSQNVAENKEKVSEIKGEINVQTQIRANSNHAVEAANAATNRAITDYDRTRHNPRRNVNRADLRDAIERARER